ncbi:hypothetical protein ACWEFL_15515 [Streptomyces sp. NPDC004838]
MSDELTPWERAFFDEPPGDPRGYQPKAPGAGPEEPPPPPPGPAGAAPRPPEEEPRQTGDRRT